MKRFFLNIVLVAVLLAVGSATAAQQAPEGLSKSTTAVGYPVGGGSTKVDLRGTELLPGATGEAKVEAKPGSTTIEVKCENMKPPSSFGAEFLTYVLWAVSPEGRTVNLGEMSLKNNGEAERKTSTPIQMFSLIVTAEPYFAVHRPSEIVVLENDVRKNTKGKIYKVDKYQLMRRAQYEKKENPLALTMDLKKVPLQMYEARNAFEIAKSNDAEKYAPEIYKKAQASLQMTENALARKAGSTTIVSGAVQTIQFSEDARALAVQRQEEERLANERKASEEAQRQARERADQEARQRAAAEAAQAQAEAARAQALLQEQIAKQKADEAARQKAEADAARAKAEVEKLRADAERQAAMQKEEAAKKAAADAELARNQAEEEKAALRAKLLNQFNQVLETRDTDRGLVVNMSDVLFDTGKYTLRQEAREKLARIAGIVLNYPDLKLEAEGHTDNVGSAEFNQKLSEQRADSVRDYLISQGIPAAAVTASGKGFSMPVASNDTAAGRQKNRRVELIVSGEVIGHTIGATAAP